MTNKDIIKITLNLVVIYVIGGLILAVVHAKTSPIRYHNKVIAEQKALKELLPEADQIDKLGDWKIHDRAAKYFVAKKGDATIGYIVQSFGKGYSSYINTFIAIDKDFKVIKVKILDQKETPGLGDVIEEDDFTNRLIGKDVEHLKAVKTENEVQKGYVQAVTGATISSRALTDDAVRNGVDFIKKTIKGGGQVNVGHK
jgi:Na+-translocating ferredoxin:NAD+ oxidoreductase subunit G